MNRSLTEAEQAERKARIAGLNDAARKVMGIGVSECRVVCTRGIADLEIAERVEIVRQTAKFDNFTPDNDPFGEHDFGSFDHNGRKIFWKFDYYDKAMQYGSEDPADPSKTARVLTIMLADEY